MKALISPQQNNLVVQVATNAKTFEVAEPLYWLDCPSNVKAYEYQYVNNTFVAYTQTPIIPTTVSMRQARLALLQNNLLDAVNAAINQGNEADKITWEYATEVNRADALVANMETALNLTATDLDALFTLASTL